MSRYARDRVRELKVANLSGYVLKKDSPSCGMERVRVHQRRDADAQRPRPLRRGAAAGGGPIYRSKRKGGSTIRCCGRTSSSGCLPISGCTSFSPIDGTRGDLVRFHTVHKLQLLAHSRTGYTELGRLVAGLKGHPRRELAERYETTFMRALARTATPGRHADVMTHILGHLKRLLDAGDRRELLEAIDAHRRGEVPLVVPITLIRHHVRRHDVEYLRDQVYLDPHPRELALRNQCNGVRS